MLKNVSDITSEGKATGLNTQDNIIGIDKSQSPDMMDVRIHFDGSYEKRLGSNTQNSVIIANSAGSGFSPTGSITNNLVAFWRFNEPSGERKDAFGGNHLTDGNAVPSDSGINNKSALFISSSGHYLYHENSSTLSTGDIDFALSAWIYLNSTSTSVNRTIIAKSDVVDGSVVLLMHMDGADGSTTFIDNGIHAHSSTPNPGAEIDTSEFVFGGASGFFNSASSPSIAVGGNDDDWFFSANNFTIDMRVRFNTISAVRGLIGQNEDASNWWGLYWNIDNNIYFKSESNGTEIHNLTFSFTPNTGTWYHLALTRHSGNFRAFVDGTTIGTVQTNTAPIADFTGALLVGGTRVDNGSSFGYQDGWLDEIRVVKGEAEWTGNFTPQSSAYTNPGSSQTNFEYKLYVRTDNIVVFEVSSSGTAADGSVSATSFGSITTSTWYNVVAWHDTGDLIGVGVNLSINTASYASGVKAGSAPLSVGAVSNGASEFFDGRIDESGFWKQVLTASDRSLIYNSGSSNTYQTAFDTKPWASFDFGASSIRWLVASVGTGVYASSNLGVTWVTIATDRSATYQFFERSKNVLVSTSDLYDSPLYWTGSVGTYMAVVNSNAPLCKYSINYQGFLILLNSNTRKRGFFYQDENTQLTGTWSSSFDIPSTQDDEITASFVLRRYLYISTRYYLYRVSYVGGNPDFSYLKVKDWGYIQRTVKYIYLEGVGQLVAGLCWDGKMRFFDGSDDQIFSNNIEQNNNMCDFSLDNISYAGSGPVISFAETDYNENVYKLCVSIGADSEQTTHIINYDGRSKAFYPYQRQLFNTMVMAESGNRRFLMAFDRSGYCHMMDSGNLDGNTTAIDDHLDSNYLFEKSPAQSQKGHETHLFFTDVNCGRIYYYDRKDFSKDYTLREDFVISGTDRKIIYHKVVDVPENYNVYQLRISSSSGTNNPWKIQRFDHFTKGQGIGKVTQ